MEVWRDIQGFEGRYQVSNHGRVRSVARTIEKGIAPREIPETILTQQVHYRGYFYVIIRLENKKIKLFIHRLVAMHFILNIEEKPIVNHKDRDKQNNHINNLEWVDAKENTNHWREHDRQGLSIGQEPVLASDLPW